MFWITEDAGVYCKHGPGKSATQPSQQFVTIAGRKVLVEPDPVGRTITGCPSVIPFKPCLFTLAVRKGYSELIRIQGKRVCLDTITGFTDGTPPGVVMYEVRTPGQGWVAEQGW